MVSTPGPVATQVSVETAPDGTGTVVQAQDFGVGSSMPVYAVSRAADNTFVANVAVTWSLIPTGGVVAGDLVPAVDNKSAVFTPHALGTGVIHTVSGALTPVDSGSINCVSAPTSDSSATNISSSGSTLSGTFNPNGGNASIYLDFGTSADYGQTTAVTLLGNGTTAVPFSFDLASLQPGTTYHYRLVELVNGDTIRFADQTFMTAESVPAMPGWARIALGMSLLAAGFVFIRSRSRLVV